MTIFKYALHIQWKKRKKVKLNKKKAAIRTIGENENENDNTDVGWHIHGKAQFLFSLFCLSAIDVIWYIAVSICEIVIGRLHSERDPSDVKKKKNRWQQKSKWIRFPYCLLYCEHWRSIDVLALQFASAIDANVSEEDAKGLVRFRYVASSVCCCVLFRLHFFLSFAHIFRSRLFVHLFAATFVANSPFVLCIPFILHISIFFSFFHWL